MKKYGLDKRVGKFLKDDRDEAKGVLYQGGFVKGKEFEI